MARGGGLALFSTRPSAGEMEREPLLPRVVGDEWNGAVEMVFCGLPVFALLGPARRTPEEGHRVGCHLWRQAGTTAEFGHERRGEVEVVPEAVHDFFDAAGALAFLREGLGEEVVTAGALGLGEGAVRDLAREFVAE